MFDRVVLGDALADDATTNDARAYADAQPGDAGDKTASEALDTMCLCTNDRKCDKCRSAGSDAARHGCRA